MEEDLLVREQYVIANKLKEESLEHLLTLVRDQAGGQERLLALAAQSFPARHSSSDLGLPQGPDSTNYLRHRPMGLFALLCPYELSNEAFITSTALLTGTPVPHARFLQANFQDYANIDVFGDFLLNSSNHASSSRIHSHNCIAKLIAELASQH